MLDFPKLLRLLTEHDVAFLIIGGVAAAVAERREEPTISHDELVAELQRDGLL